MANKTMSDEEIEHLRTHSFQRGVECGADRAPKGMTALLADVRAFHVATDTPVLERPQIAPPVRADLRGDLLDEEVRELHGAVAVDDLPGIADALADIIYVAIGTALEFGIPLDKVWAEVQRSNMAKIDPATGKVRKRDDGKILKPEGWQPPDVAGALEMPHLVECDRCAGKQPDCRFCNGSGIVAEVQF